MPVSNATCHRVLQSRLAWLRIGLWSFLLCCAGGADGDFAGGRIRLLFSVEAEREAELYVLSLYPSLSGVPNITVLRVINGPAKATLTKFMVQWFGHSVFFLLAHVQTEKIIILIGTLITLELTEDFSIYAYVLSKHGYLLVLLYTSLM